MKKHSDIRPWAILFWLAIWQLASMALDKPILLVSPINVVCRLGELALTADFWRSIGFSALRILSGFLLASALGILAAALASGSQRIRELLAPLVLTAKSVPVASFIILALIWFSSRNLSVLISFLMVFPVIYTNVLDGIRAADRQLLEMAQVFRLSPMRKIRCLYLPQVMPYFEAACTVGLGLCWKSGVAAEVIGMPTGSIGEKLQQAKVYLDTPDLFAWTLVIVILSLGFEKLFLWALKKAALVAERM